MTEIEATAHAIGKTAQTLNKPILTCFMGDLRTQAGIDVLQQYQVPNYPYPERAALAFAAMRDYANILKQQKQNFVSFAVDKSKVRTIIDTMRQKGRVTIGEAEGREILAAYGFAMPQSQLAKSPDEAVACADKIGYPVVLKISSPDILHKTDIGGVKVGLRSAEEVRDAFELMVFRAQRYLPDAQIDGCLVQQQAAKGLEILVGVNRDAQFGPLVTFGLGGIYVEALKDVAFRLAPFSREDAYALLKEIRARSLLDGVRGEPPVDKDALVDALLRIGQLVTDFPEIVELDINPLIAYRQGAGLLALDARMILG
jgi:acetyltransferase